jgi:hypothetical protein
MMGGGAWGRGACMSRKHAERCRSRCTGAAHRFVEASGAGKRGALSGARCGQQPTDRPRPNGAKRCALRRLLVRQVRAARGVRPAGQQRAQKGTHGCVVGLLPGLDISGRVSDA